MPKFRGHAKWSENEWNQSFVKLKYFTVIWLSEGRDVINVDCGDACWLSDTVSVIGWTLWHIRQVADCRSQITLITQLICVQRIRHSKGQSTVLLETIWHFNVGWLCYFSGRCYRLSIVCVYSMPTFVQLLLLRAVAAVLSVG